MDINSFGNGISPETEPDIPQLVQQASSIVSNIESSWAKKKLFVISGGNEVQTYANDQWVARISNHPQAHSKMVKYIAGSTEDIDASHTAYEAQYIDTLSTYDIQKILSKSPTSIAYTVKLVYLMPFPLKDRVFHELIVVHKDSAEDGEFFVISVPIPPLPSAKLRLVSASYHSIEWVKDGKWVMCTKANPGGIIPKFLANSSLPSVICHDVEAFFKYIKHS